MVKESYQVIKKEQIAKIQDSMIASVDVQHTDLTTLRVYLNGKIGLAKASGSYDEIELEKNAIQNGKEGTVYLSEPTTNKQIEIVYNYMIAKGSDFVSDMKDFIRTFHELFPEIKLYNHIKLIDHAYHLINNAGMYLSYQDHILDMDIRYTYQRDGMEKNGHFYCRGRRYEKDVFVHYLSNLFQVLLQPSHDLPEESLPIIVSTQDQVFFQKLISMLNGKRYIDSSVSFPDEMQNLAFHPSFSFFQSRDPEIHFIPFFDAEGIVNAGYRIPLIENGRIVTPYTNKEIALKTGLPLTGSSHASWGDVPDLELQAFDIKPTHQNLSDILCGQNGLVLNQLSMDHNQDNDMVHISADQVFVTDGKQYISHVPPISFTISWKDLFREHFKGVTIEPLVPFSNHFGVVFHSVPYRWQT